MGGTGFQASIPILAATGGALGSAGSTAATGGSLSRALMSATLGGLGGYGIGTLGAPLLAADVTLPAGAGLSTTTAPGASIPAGLTPTGTNLAGTSLMPGDATDRPKLGALEKAIWAQYLGGQLGSLLNPKPQPISFGPIQGMTPPALPNPTQFMIPVQPPQPPVFRL